MNRSQLKVSTSSQFERKSKLLRVSRVDWRRWLYFYAWGRLHGTNESSNVWCSNTEFQGAEHLGETSIIQLASKLSSHSTN